MFLGLNPKPTLLMAVPQRGDSKFSSSQYALNKQHPKQGASYTPAASSVIPFSGGGSKWVFMLATPIPSHRAGGTARADLLYRTQSYKHLLPHCPLAWCWLQKNLSQKLDCSCYWGYLQSTHVVIQAFFSLKCDCKK